MAVIFAFFNFLFFRILSAAMFDDPMTIWASALTAIVVTLIMAFAGPFGLMFAFDDSDGRERLRMERLILVCIAACAVSILVAFLIVLGFSERLFDDISYWRRRRDLFQQDIFWFGVMISIPVLVHLGFFFRQFRRQE